MRKKFIISLYILREIIPNYLVGLGFLSVILFIVQLFYVIRLAVEKGIAYSKAFSMLMLFLPFILQITLPIAVIIGVTLAIARFSDDSEIIAMRSCGISLSKIFLPAILFGVFMTTFTLFFYEYVYPMGIKAYIKSKLEIYEINPTAELSKSLSYDTIDGIKITVDSVNPQSNELKNVRINYENEDKIIFARRALLLGKDYDKNVFPLILFNATSHPANMMLPKKDRELFDEQLSIEQTIYIPDRSDNNLLPSGNMLWSLSEFAENLESRRFSLIASNLKDMNKIVMLNIEYKELDKNYNDFKKQNKEPVESKAKKKYKKLLLEKRKARKKLQIRKRRYEKAISGRYGALTSTSSLGYDEYLFHRKLNFALTALAFAILGAPLGIFAKRTGKSLGFGISVLIVILFFLMTFSGSFLVKNKYMSPILAGWYPSIVFYPISIMLIWIKLSGRDGFRDILVELHFNISKYIKTKIKRKK